MAELLSRGLQRQILTDLAGVYPKRVNISGAWDDVDRNTLIVNLRYLTEHHMVDMQWLALQNGEMKLGAPCITARGLDFLQDDGGLSAILGVVTVKLHDDSIKALLIARVNSTDAEEGVKDQLKDAIRSLPAEATKSVAMRLLEYGVSQSPLALAAFQKLIGL
ncbi:hypothetical protein [Cypionkella sinensis]|uniref:Uncharacterized protein n=1 Tax=Cypionkella sinensis TaxID=1756043 RepID=A0ABV7IZR5_9RHOB